MKNTAHLPLLFCLLLTTVLGGQTQVGEDFTRPGTNGLYGYSVDISDSGRGLIVGEPDFDGNRDTSSAYIYYRTDDGKWDQEFELQDAGNGRALGSSVAISGSGTVTAMGAEGTDANGSSLVAAYRFVVINWLREGQLIRADVTNFRLGCSVALSQDGKTMAIGRCGPPGAVEVYTFNDTNERWERRGNRVMESVSEDRQVKLSANGNRLVVASASGGNGRGEVRVYDWNGTNYGQFGDPLFGQSNGDDFGFDIDLSNDGKRMIIGVPGANNGRGVALLLEEGDQAWNTLYVANGQSNNQLLGWSVGISGDGQVYAFGAPGTERGNGAAFVAQWINGQHVPVATLEGRDQEEWGRDLALDGDGDRIVVSTPEFTGKPGRVAVFDLNVMTSTTEYHASVRQLFPNPTQGQLSLSGEGSEVMEPAVHDLLGRKLLAFPDRSTRFDLGGLVAGTYVITWREGARKFRKRVVVR